MCIHTYMHTCIPSCIMRPAQESYGLAFLCMYACMYVCMHVCVCVCGGLLASIFVRMCMYARVMSSHPLQKSYDPLNHVLQQCPSLGLASPCECCMSDPVCEGINVGHVYKCYGLNKLCLLVRFFLSTSVCMHAYWLWRYDCTFSICRRTMD
jgi:hypothetical protein